MITSLSYIFLFAVALALSFAPSNPRLRRMAQLAATAMAVPIGLVVLAGVGLSIFLFVGAPPNLDQLQKHFPAQRQDLETILRMSNQDSQFTRIDPRFIDQSAPNEGRYMAGDPKAALSKARWDQYRDIYNRNHIDLGVARDSANDAFIMFGSEGLLDRGHATGIVFCAEPTTSPQPDVFRYEPCTSTESVGSGNEVENPHREAFTFRHLVGRWYVYDQGPG